MSNSMPLESLLHVKCTALGNTCTSSCSFEISMPINVSLGMCSIPALWMRTPRRVLTSVRAYYTMATGDLAQILS